MHHLITSNTRLQIIKARLVKGVPLDVAMAAFEAGLVTVHNPGFDVWRAVAEAINGIAVLAGRETSDVFAADAQKAYHEVKNNPGCRLIDSVIVNKIVDGSPLEAAYAVLKDKLYQNEEAVRNSDFETMAADMNAIAAATGRQQADIHKTTVTAAVTQILLGIDPDSVGKARKDWYLPPMLARTEEIRKEIIRDYSHLWELNDEGHRVEHFDAVYRCGIYLNDRLGGKYSQAVILMAAFFHDMFAWSRKNHHEMSATWISTTDFPIMRHFTPDERFLIAIGCEEHRASRKTPFTHEFGELISSADRGFPASAQELLARALRSRSKTGEDDLTKRVRAVAHLKEKYGVDGYARLPDMYREAFAEELKVQAQEVMAL